MKLNINDDDRMIAVITDALSDLTRLKIIKTILSDEHLCYSDVAKEIGVKPATISYHVPKLIDAGIVSNKRERKNERARKTLNVDVSKIVIELK